MLFQVPNMNTKLLACNLLLPVFAENYMQSLMLAVNHGAMVVMTNAQHRNMSPAGRSFQLSSAQTCVVKISCCSGGCNKPRHSLYSMQLVL